MIRPTLVRYQLDQQPCPVTLDSTSVLPDAILVLDTFFHVVLFHGEHVAAWVRAGYADVPEYANFRSMLQAAESDALALLTNRFPIPHFVRTSQNESQSRFLISRLNPTTTHVSSSSSGGTGQNLLGGYYGSAQHHEPVVGTAVFTDDVSLQVFMDHLRRLAVTPAQSATAR